MFKTLQKEILVQMNCWGSIDDEMRQGGMQKWLQVR